MEPAAREHGRARQAICVLIQAGWRPRRPRGFEEISLKRATVSPGLGAGSGRDLQPNALSCSASSAACTSSIRRFRPCSLGALCRPSRPTMDGRSLGASGFRRLQGRGARGGSWNSGVGRQEGRRPDRWGSADVAAAAAADSVGWSFGESVFGNPVISPVFSDDRYSGPSLTTFHDRPLRLRPPPRRCSRVFSSNAAEPDFFCVLLAKKPGRIRCGLAGFTLPAGRAAPVLPVSRLSAPKPRPTGPSGRQPRSRPRWYRAARRPCCRRAPPAGSRPPSPSP